MIEVLFEKIQNNISYVADDFIKLFNIDNSNYLQNKID